MFAVINTLAYSFFIVLKVLYICYMQSMAADFLADYIFLAVGRVGSSTDLIVQRVEFVLDADKRSYLMDLLHAQKANGTHGKVIVFSRICCFLDRT